MISWHYPIEIMSEIVVKENADSFTITLARQGRRIDALRLSGLQNIENVSLVYPKNCNFIREVGANSLRRLVKHGLDPLEFLVFEIPHVMAFTSDLDPALAA